MKNDDTVHVTIRIPAKLHKRLKAAASDSEPPTSYNREVVRRLIESFKPHIEITQLAKRIAQLEEKP